MEGFWRGFWGGTDTFRVLGVWRAYAVAKDLGPQALSCDYHQSRARR